MESKDRAELLRKESNEAWAKGCIIIDDLGNNVSHNPKLIAIRLKWIKESLYPPHPFINLNHK